MTFFDRLKFMVERAVQTLLQSAKCAVNNLNTGERKSLRLELCVKCSTASLLYNGRRRRASIAAVLCCALS
jgi:hypothetical protein